MRKLNPGFDLNYFSNGINEERERVFDDNMNNFVTSQNPNYYVGPYSSFSKGGGQPIIVKGDQKFSA